MTDDAAVGDDGADVDVVDVPLTPAHVAQQPGLLPVPKGQDKVHNESWTRTEPRLPEVRFR